MLAVKPQAGKICCVNQHLLAYCFDMKFEKIANILCSRK